MIVLNLVGKLTLSAIQISNRTLYSFVYHCTITTDGHKLINQLD